MISADGMISPRGAAQKPNPLADLAGVPRLRKIDDATTESAANNAIAAGYRSGYARPGQMAGQGFSAGAQQRMRAAQQQAAGVAAGAQQAANIRAEDQSFNAGQDLAQQMMNISRMNDNYQIMTGMQGANFQKRMARQQNAYGLQQARNLASMKLRLALLGQLE